MINSSNVAFGWMLDTGGMISRAVAGNDNYPGIGVWPISISELKNLSPYNYNDFYKLNRLTIGGDPTPEYDIYSYSLPGGKYGKFIMMQESDSNNDSIYQTPRNNYKISYSSPFFNLADSKGLQYKFKSLGNYEAQPGMFSWNLSSVHDQITGKERLSVVFNVSPKLG